MTTSLFVRVSRGLLARPRLLASVTVGAGSFVLLPGPWPLEPSTCALLAWNAGAWMYLVLVVLMVWGDDTDGMRQRALTQDDGSFVVLAGVVLSAAAVLLAVNTQLAQAKHLQDVQRTLHIGLAALTVLSGWVFMQTLFALHYAHDFYLARTRKQPDPLAFPGTPDPRYGDFMYFACVIGTSAQTADISFQGSGLRGVGTLHCVLAFFFNATLLALTINIAAGLAQ